MHRLHLFGQPALFDADGQPLSMRTSTSLYLLAYLCRHRETSLARDQVAGALWPESPESRARQNLRQALHHLRQALEPRTGDGDRGACLDVGRTVIRLRSEAPLWVDVDAFERHLQRADEEEDDADRAHHLESAIALHRGPFLAAYDAEWCLEKREFLKARYAEALDRMIDLSARWGRREDAVAYAEEVLRSNPLREDVHRRLMTLHYQMGDRAAALRQYRRCRRRLGDDLGVDPEPTTERLCRAIEANAPLDDLDDDRRSRTPTNLPHLLTRFVGRDEDIDALAPLLERERLVTLTGVGGCGKTRLAIELGHRQSERFSCGVWFVDLTPLTDPHWVPQAIASTLKRPQAKIQAVVDELIDHFQAGPTLLILDNCEHVVETCARLARRLLEACPELTVLATSREPLRLSGERVWALQPLTVPAPGASPKELKTYAIVRMFLDQARGFRPDFRLTERNAEALVAICQAADGIPLAIELAVTWLRVLSLPEIAERLATGPDLLTAQTRDMPPRHRSMQAVFEHSWALLSERSRALFRRLSVFRGGFTRRAAEVVAEASLMGLSELVDKSLLDRDAGGRYACHQLVRQFSEAKLQNAGEADRMRDRHLRFVLELVESAEAELAGEAQAEGLQRLIVESDNIRAALEWALEADRADEALRLVGALGRFWSLRGALTEGRQWLNRALGRLEQAEPPVRAKALHQAGELAWRQGDYAAAARHQQRGLEIYRRLGDQAGVSKTLVGLGRVAHEQGRLQEATELFHESLEIERALNDPRGMAVALGNLGEIKLERGDPAGADADLEQSLTILRELGDQAAVCNVLNNLGYVASVAGDVERARACLDESLAIARELDDKRGIAMALGNLGNLALEEKDWQRADASLTEIAEIFREMNDRRNLSVALNKLGQVALEQDDADRARRCLRESLMICLEMGDQLAMAEVLCGIADVLRLDGRATQAARLHGVLAALMDQIQAALQAHERRLYDRTRTSLEATLGPEAYRVHVEQGRADSVDDVVELVQMAL